MKLTGIDVEGGGGVGGLVFKLSGNTVLHALALSVTL